MRKCEKHLQQLRKEHSGDSTDFPPPHIFFSPRVSRSLYSTSKITPVLTSKTCPSKLILWFIQLELHQVMFLNFGVLSLVSHREGIIFKSPPFFLIPECTLQYSITT